MFYAVDVEGSAALRFQSQAGTGEHSIASIAAGVSVQLVPLSTWFGGAAASM